MGAEKLFALVKCVALVVPLKPGMEEMYCEALSHSAGAMPTARARTVISSSSRYVAFMWPVSLPSESRVASAVKFAVKG